MEECIDGGLGVERPADVAWMCQLYIGSHFPKCHRWINKSNFGIKSRASRQSCQGRPFRP